MNNTELTKKLKEKAKELGFVLAGITSPDAPPHMDIYKGWLKAGRHGEMDYLAREQAIGRRADPVRVLPECKSILVLGIPYDNPVNREDILPGSGQIAAYAWGEDYHEVLKPRLKELVAYLENLIGHAVPNRWYTDTGPILERELAQRAGLGWIGKNTMLINPKRGSYFLLAEILLGVKLDIDAPITTDHCGTCRRCINACPTSCILEDRTLDATRCISYLTIELKGTVPTALRSQMGEWIFGCDICQVVCPWNERFAEHSGDPAFSRQIAPVKLSEEIEIDTQRFNAKFKTSPVMRSKRRGYLRNVAIALGNKDSVDSLSFLITALVKDKEPEVRAHAAWAIGNIGGKEARSTLLKAAQHESDPQVLEEIQVALGSG